MAKKYICPGCEKEFATRQSLWNHKQRCQRQYTPRNRVFDDYVDPKTYRSIVAVKSPMESPHKPMPENAKIRNLLNDIVNDDPDRKAVHKGCSITSPTTPPPAIVYSPIKKHQNRSKYYQHYHHHLRDR